MSNLGGMKIGVWFGDEIGFYIDLFMVIGVNINVFCEVFVFQ